MTVRRPSTSNVPSRSVIRNANPNSSFSSSIVLVGSYTGLSNSSGQTGIVAGVAAQAVGDFILVHSGQVAGNVLVPTATGITFTQIQLFTGSNSENTTGAWYYIATDTTARDITVRGRSAANDVLVGMASVWSGVDPTNPFDVASSMGALAAPTTPFDMPVPAMTTVTAGAVAIVCVGTGNDTTHSPQTSGWVQAQMVNTTIGDDYCGSVSYRKVDTPGDTGTINIRQTTSGGIAARYIEFALKPKVQQ